MKETFRKIIMSYKEIFDKKIENSTVVVAFICTVLFWVWFFVNNSGNINLWNSLKANILETKKIKKQANIIIIDWKKYRLILIEG